MEVSSNCQSRTLTRSILISPCLKIPNIITPNGDLVNERFVVEGLKGEEWKLEVFNRWGTNVYETSSYHQDWGERALPGVYYYRLRHASTQHTYTGWIEVVR